MRSWTDAQRLAIEDRGNNILVNAGAGSGKTAVLTERIARLVLGGARIKDMLVVTFTNAAAGELKKRIQKRLMELGGDESLTESERAFAKEQSGQFHLANISTLHAFCSSLLRRHFHSAGIDPAYKILDDYQGALLRSEAAEEVLLERYAQADPDFLALDEGFGKRREGLAELLLWLYDFLHTGAQPWERLQTYIDAYALSPEELGQSAHYALACDQCAAALRTCVKELQSARGMFPQFGGHEKNLAFFDDLITRVRGIARAMERREQSAVQALEGFTFGRLLFNSKAEIPAPKDEIKAAWDRAKKAIAAFDARLLNAQEQAAHLKVILPQLEVLRGILLDFEVVFKRKKTQKSMVDYSDLEHMTLKALEEEGIREEYKERFSYIFVDEYQDTSAVQERIISLISRENNLFFVGDVKQSIYRFRAADPSLFTARAAAYAKGEGGTLINLNKNFRSDPNILHAVNDIFSIAMEQAGEIAYTDADKLTSPREEENPLHCILDVIDSNREEGDGEEAPDKTDCEAMRAADHILARVGSVREGKKVAFGDVAILLRSTKNTAEVFAKVLASRGIPCYVELSGGYYMALEVQILLNLLRLVDNKRQDIPLLSTLRMGLCGFNDEHLASLRESFPKGSLHQAMADCSKTDTETGRACKRVLEFLSKSKSRSKLVPLEQFTAELIDGTYFKDLLSVLDGGEVRSANIEALLERIRQYEAGSSRGLYGFLNNIDMAFAAGKDMSEARVTTQGSDCVKIMSIHKSKGLEFPIVILAGVGKLYNMRDAQKRMVAASKLGIGAKCFDAKNRQLSQTLYNHCIANALKSQTKAEELRMLYVAMTRAEHELIMIGTANIAKKRADWLQGGKRCSLDYMMGVLARTKSAAEVMGYFAGTYSEVDGQWRINAVDSSELSQNQRKRLANEAVTALLSHSKPSQLEFFEYATKPAVTKVSVSDIGGAQTYRYKIQKTPMFLQKERMSAADIGSATHLALMHLDFGRSDEASLREQLEQLVQAEVMTREEASAVRIPTIGNFLTTDLARRMAKGSLQREVPFLMQCTRRELGMGDDDEKLCLQGIIDACFVEDNEYVAVDYKTDAIQGSAQETAQKHFDQLGWYKKALERLTGKRVKEAYIVLLQTGECVRMT